MIKNDRQFRIIRARVDRLSELAEELEQRLRTGGRDPRTELELKAVRGEVKRMSDELAEYEGLRHGELEVGSARSLEDVPRLLIRARIAAGLTQAELAERLGLKAQQIQRYEADDYRSASLSRLQEVAEALGVRLADTEEPASVLPSVRTMLRRLESFGIDRRLLRDRIAPVGFRSGHEDAADVLSLIARVARVFGVEPASVLEGKPPAVGLPSAVAAFKAPARTNREQVTAYAAYAHYLAIQVLEATAHLDARPVPRSPRAMAQLIERHGGRTFRGTVEAVWALGVPILPLDDPGAFHAAYWRHGGRGVIVLKQRLRKLAVWWFDLLHEVLHAADKPDEGEREVIDLPPDDPRRRESGEEREANEWAAEVLLDDPERLFQLVLEKSQRKVPRLKRTVPLVARMEGVDVGALAYYVAHRLRERDVDWWATATTLQPDSDDPWSICRDVFLANAELERLTPIDQELLLRALATDSRDIDPRSRGHGGPQKDDEDR